MRLKFNKEIEFFIKKFFFSESFLLKRRLERSIKKRDENEIELLGESIDDAIGEAFDKTAKLIGLPYPGGAEIERKAQEGDENKFLLPRPLIKEENIKIGKARQINSDLPFFKNQFIMPVKGIISGVYGSQRILNGKPRWPHYGIDIAANQGTKIKSSASGIVTMAEPDLYYTGGTIIMDHGHGISTIYSHLAKLNVQVGDEILQGDIIGTVGSTGRSTGPHLDFRVNWFQTRLDPMSILMK